LNFTGWNLKVALHFRARDAVLGAKRKNVVVILQVEFSHQSASSANDGERKDSEMRAIRRRAGRIN
jgi:hypothetical protein